MIVRARWVLPIDRAPIHGGWIEHDAGRIVDVGRGEPPGQATDLGDVAILPGLVNAHTHLELSWMSGRVPPAASMDAWIRQLMALRRGGPPGGEAASSRAMKEAASAMRATGTVLAGDISNTLSSPRVLAEAGIGGVVFHEILGFNQTDAVRATNEAWARADEAAAGLKAAGWNQITVSVCPHAPYSTSPALIREIAGRNRGILSMHLAESPEEVTFLKTGGGPIRRMLEELGVWTPAWRVPMCDPVTFVSDLGYLKPGALVVHGVQLTDANLEKLRESGVTLVTCPRSNEWVGAGTPRVARFYDVNVPVAIGTDSLASVPTLNMFDELAELRRIAPEVSASALLDSATRQGARALGFADAYGTIGKGKRASFVSVRVPAGVRDVEEYLVSGVPETAVNLIR
jgi:cytosine/adenosine deaminase-related metal-dependent hydrolase